MYGMKIACMDQVLFGPVLVLIVVKIIWSTVRMRNKKIFSLFLDQNICCGYLKEPFQ